MTIYISNSTTSSDNIELGYAQITTGFTTASGTLVDVTGLSTTVTIASRPVRIDVGGQFLQNDTAGDGILLCLLEDGTIIAQQEVGFGEANECYSVSLSARRNPAAGAYTYKVQMQAILGGNANLNPVSGGTPGLPVAHIQVVQV